MTDQHVLTLVNLDAALAQLGQPVRHYVSYGSVEFLAQRLYAEACAAVADGSLKQEDMLEWTRGKLKEVFGTEYVKPERIPITQPLGQTERERGKWKRRP